MYRFCEFIFALLVFVITSPIWGLCACLIWIHDWHSPFYIAPRVGKDNRLFKMVKLRSMLPGSDRLQIDSTAANDARLTPIGIRVRKYKVDELLQFWHVLRGEMSIVGPRPNIRRETDLYTSVEKQILTVKPGITDFSSIVFSDLADILKNAEDPNIAYNQLVRPWKSRLILFYIQKKSFWVDMKIIGLTVMALINHNWTNKKLSRLLKKMGAEEQLVEVAMRDKLLVPFPPPGALSIVTSRNQPDEMQC